MAQFIKYRIEGTADTEPLNKAAAAMKGVEKAAGDADKALKHLEEGIIQGIGIGLSNNLLTSLRQIPALFTQAVREGIQFNATIESSRLGIAAVLKQFDTTGKFTNFQAALDEAGAAIDLLKEKAKTSPATFQQLVGAFQGLSGAFASAGLSMREQVDTVVLMSQALSGLGIANEQILQESRAIVTGNITEDAAAARILGITKADIDRAKEAGNLFGFLQEKLGAFAEAGAVGARSFNTQLSNLNDSLDQLKATATKEFFEVIRDGLAGINEQLAKEDADRWAAGLGRALAAPVEGTRSLPALYKEFQKSTGANPVLKALDLAFTPMRKISEFMTSGVRDAFTSGSQSKLVEQLNAETQQLQTQLRTAKDQVSQRKAIAALENTIMARQGEADAADGETATQLRHHLDTLNRIWQVRSDLAGSAKDEAKAARETAEAAAKRHEASVAAFGRSQDILRSGLTGADADAWDSGRANELRTALSLNLGLDRDAQREKFARAIEAQPEDSRGALFDQLEELVKLETSLHQKEKEREDQAAKLAKKKEEITQSAREEFGILQAEVAGNDELAAHLRTEKQIREEIQRLIDAGIDDPALNAQIRKNAELEKEVQLRDRAEQRLAAQQQLEDLKPTGLGPVDGRGGRAARQRREARADFERQVNRDIREAGLGGEEANAARARKLAEFDQARLDAQGRIGGAATRSAFDQLGTRDNLLDVGRFKPAYEGGLATGTGPSDDFLSLKRSFPELKPLVSTSPAATAAEGGSPRNGGEDKLGGAADQLKTAAAQTTASAQVIKAAASQIGTSTQGIASAIEDIKHRLAALERNQGSTGGY